MSFRDVSVQLTSQLSKEEKQAQGIFFTPKEARDVLFAVLDRFEVTPTSILEPSCGSGEFIEDLYERYSTSSIRGLELNPLLAGSIEHENIRNIDFMDYEGRHDLIIGNPPYFVIEKSEETAKCQVGRPNIFVQFIYKCVDEHLTEDGVLAFVVPTSLFNCTYYEPLRKYLFENTTILAAEMLPGKYIDTAQKTFALVLRKGKQNDDYFVKCNDCVFLTPYYSELRELLTGSTTLERSGFEAKTGDVVWNQERDNLSNEGTLVIYSSNFSTGSMILHNLVEPKKQYITAFRRPPISGKTILINRGYGNTTYKLTTVIADYPSYYAENHVIVIKPKTPEAVENIEKVYRSLCDQRTKLFIEYFVGKGALSKTELERCLPIWLD